ncbi:predicted protein [Sclerotinia sclerotiorum 1980 UF-70]|uniref:Uncharacterized protein n=1 Tax=Sclerotinia sclerotiorum (strain ATCC 18683 / 1980 / Ss-1) TaxID=665079 RepID=A7E937_SCLS1|nr:predicted protein [Sclerotinia sclerotiorum 1980 UF-70]EDN96889.1 predicted protein [Sclerotinia sclerotiorum 1980 UF-70]
MPRIFISFLKILFLFQITYYNNTFQRARRSSTSKFVAAIHPNSPMLVAITILLNTNSENIRLYLDYVSQSYLFKDKYNDIQPPNFQEVDTSDRSSHHDLRDPYIKYPKGNSQEYLK